MALHESYKLAKPDNGGEEEKAKQWIIDYIEVLSAVLLGTGTNGALVYCKSISILAIVSEERGSRERTSKSCFMCVTSVVPVNGDAPSEMIAKKRSWAGVRLFSAAMEMNVGFPRSPGLAERVQKL